MNKRFYVIVFLVLCVSVLLLGFSFAKESGTNNIITLAEEITNDYRIIYSNSNHLKTDGNNTTDISLINKKNESEEYAIVFTELNDVDYKNVYYRLDNGPTTLLENGTINLDVLAPYGSDGDHVLHKLSIYTRDNSSYNFKIGIKTVEKNIFTNFIKNDSDVYLDNEGNYRYYGAVVNNNYIKYNEEIYRIIGIIDGKIKLISEIKGLGVYDTTLGVYPTLKDYLYSFNNSMVNINNVLQFNTWMADSGYWLLDEVGTDVYYASQKNGVGLTSKLVDYYLRYVVELEGDFILVNGDGSINSPYEVSYGG